MPAQRFRIQLSRWTRRRLFLTVSLINLAFSLTTGAFILLWARMADLSPAMRHFTRYILVQGHLATENVVAAWYSSMILLAIAGASMLAWAADARNIAGGKRHGWLLMAAVFLVLSLDEIGSFHERVGMLPFLSDRAAGWVYVLAAPILAVGAFMLAFAWQHVRKVPAAFRLMAAGVGMFLMNPVVESIEMAMIHGEGAIQGTWQRTLHDVLLVIEEGGLELFGALCFFAATCLYVAARAGEVSEWVIGRRTVLWASRLVTAMLIVGVFVSSWIVARLPAGDTGIPANWFPAAAWMLVALVALARVSGHQRSDRVVAGAALLISAGCGAGLYVYVGWLASRASWFTPVAGVLFAGLTLEALLGTYFFTRSPTSSIASPTLRRPRPNPS